MSLKRHSSTLQRISSLKKGTLRGGSRLAGRLSYGASLKLLRGSRPAGEIERELQEARDLALEIGWSLRRSEERLDTALHRIDSTLLELAAQRERIQELERDLGIER